MKFPSKNTRELYSHLLETFPNEKRYRLKEYVQLCNSFSGRMLKLNKYSRMLLNKNDDSHFLKDVKDLGDRVLDYHRDAPPLDDNFFVVG
jgi:hypothetical protein